MESNFERALAFTLKYEGGYVDHPFDRGGATNFGITQATYDVHNGVTSRDVRHITLAEVKTIYLNNYWMAIGGNTLPDKTDIAVFDFAVNSGPARALRYLELWPDLPGYLNARERLFRRIAGGNQAVFLKGWLNRIKALRTYLGV